MTSSSIENLKKAGYDDAIGILAVRELKAVKKTYTEETEQAQKIVPENELQQQP